MRRWLRFAVVLCAVGLIMIRGTAQNTVNGFDIIIALDNSASMANTDPVADRGVRALGGAMSTPTDPNGLRFEAARALLTALAQAKESAPNAPDIGVHIVAYNHLAPVELLPWTEVTYANLENFNFEAPPPSGDSDFIEVYDYALRNFTERANGRSQIFLNITDSLPCDRSASEGVFSTNTGGLSSDRTNHRFPNASDRSNPIRQAECLLPATMSAHLNHISSVVFRGNAGVNIKSFIYHVNSLGGNYWVPTGLGNVQAAFRNLPYGGGQLRIQGLTGDDNLSINTLPVLMFDDILDTIGGANALNLTDASMGVDVKDYQQQVDVLLIGNNPDNPPALENLGAADNEILWGFSNGQVQWIRLTRPEPDKWTVARASKIFTRTVDAIAQAQLLRADDNTVIDPAVIQRFESVKLRYRLGAENEHWVSQSYTPDVAISVSGGSRYNLKSLSRITDGVFESEPFIMGRPGVYTFLIDVSDEPRYSPDGGASLSVQVEDIAWRWEFGTVEAADSSQPQMDITRSQDLQVVLKGTVSGAEVALPDLLTARLSLTGTACSSPNGEQRTITLTRAADGMSYFVLGNLDFEAGSCTISAEISALEEDVQPYLTDGSQTVVAPFVLSQLTVRSTAVLDIELLDQRDEIISGALNASASSLTNDTPAYTIEDLQTSPGIRAVNIAGTGINLPQIYWLENEIVFEMRIVSQNVAASPRFIELNNNISAAQPIPFTLRLAQIGTNTGNLADQYNVSLRADTGREGYYTATLRGLPEGNYALEITLLRDNPTYQLIPEQEYAPALTADPNRNPVFTALIRVQANDLVKIQKIGMSLFAVLLTLWVVIRFIRRWLEGRGKLSGEVVIYKYPEGQSAREVLRRALDSKTNTYELPEIATLTEDLVLIPLYDVHISTRARKDLAQRGAAWVRINGADAVLLEPNQSYRFFQDKDYFIVLPRGSFNLPEQD